MTAESYVRRHRPGDIVTTNVAIVGAGQSGLAAARAAREAGLQAVILEAGERAVGSWPLYYDSLTLFSPAEYSAIPGTAFPGDPGHYPRRDEVVDYLEQFAKRLDVPIRTQARVESVEPNGRGFLVHAAGGDTVVADCVVAASGSFSNPYLPSVPGQQEFGGRIVHSSAYRDPAAYAGRRVVVVGAGNSATQIGYELAQVAAVTLATRRPIKFWEQRSGGRDVHYWLKTSGFDDQPASWAGPALSPTPVLDTGIYRQALESGALDRRPMFSHFDATGVLWSDGSREDVDEVIFATGFRPSLAYLRPLGALDADGLPFHDGGISTTCPGLAYVGLELQRSFASNTLRGAYRDARHVMAALAGHVNDAASAVGL